MNNITSELHTLLGIKNEPINLLYIPFHYAEPNKPIVIPGFVGASWGNIDHSQQPYLLKDDTVNVFGFQALGGEGAGIELHPEISQTVITYILQGDMDMIIKKPNAQPTISPMRGQIKPTVELI